MMNTNLNFSFKNHFQCVKTVMGWGYTADSVGGDIIRIDGSDLLMHCLKKTVK